MRKRVAIRSVVIDVVVVVVVVGAASFDGCSIICRSGGIGRRPGLKIPWVVIPVPVRPRSPAFLFEIVSHVIERLHIE